MKIKVIYALIAFCCGIIGGSVSAQTFNNIYYDYDLGLAPSSVYHVGMSEYDTPARLALCPHPEQYFYWSTDGGNATSFKNWGYSLKLRNFGIGARRYSIDSHWIRDYAISFGFGDASSAFGIGYLWSVGDKDFFNRDKSLIMNYLIRPFDFISLSIAEKLSLERKWNETSVQLGLRPLGTSFLTLYGSTAIEKDVDVEDIPWTFGGIIELAHGIDLIGQYNSDKSIRIGFNLNLGNLGFGGRGNYDKDNELASYIYHIRTGSLRPSIIAEKTSSRNNCVPIELHGRVNYTKYLLFDNSKTRFFDILSDIRSAADDNRVSILAINLSGLSILPENGWEIRDELLKCKQAGKQIIIFVDNVGMTGYHLASVADKIVIDPVGSMILPGFASSRTYFKGALDKLGIGFDEWRFFEYKSAAEVLSRDSFSPANRKQSQAYVDDRYEFVRSEICQSRGISENYFDSLIDNQVYFDAAGAIKAGLVDTVGRWSDKGKIIAEFIKRPYGVISTKNLYDKALVTDEWGQPDKIAVVYGLGECALDYGIRARWLEKVFLALAGDYSVKGVVFRVDSPGGDGMASDMVAQAIKKCAAQKPVIVSQGQVAASGGYWISTYGTEILAGPNSVTGSIGVIGGWVYDNGLADKIGFTRDFVKRGEHADFTSGVSFPYIGLTLPSRNLTLEERKIVEQAIKAHYEEFKGKVAEGREMSVEDIEKIAQGRIYSGLRGIDNGLVDQIGGLYDAIDNAKLRAGIDPEEKVEIVEIPKYKGLFDLKSKITPSFTVSENEPIITYLKMLLEGPNCFLPMMVPGSYPDYEN